MMEKDVDISNTKQNSSKHTLLMVLTCIIPFLLLFGVVKYFGFSANYLWFGAILLCIGMHIWMMKKHKEDHQHG